MKRFVVVGLALLLFWVSKAQTVDSDDFHIHRNSLANSFLKFQNEKKGRVVFLGGSITFNPGWRDSVCNYLQQKFPETEFDFINAGIPSMGSTPGAFRFEQDVLKNGPVDLLFEEAAVNDDTNERTSTEIIRGMEGIVRHALTSNPACDVVLMYFADPGKTEHYRKGEVPGEIQLHEKVAAHYNISAINLAREVTARMDAGEFDWKNDFKDLHPSPFGQNVYFQSIKTFLEKEWEIGQAKKTVTPHDVPQPADPSSYDNGKLVQPAPRKPIKGWALVENWKPADGKGTRANYVDVPMLEGNYPGKIVKFHFEGDAVGIAVAAGPDAGIVEYSIDDTPWKKQDLFTAWSSGLHLPWFYTLGAGLKPGSHVLQIRLSKDKNPESTGNFCRIRYFYFNAKEE
jgi:sialidase-1